MKATAKTTKAAPKTKTTGKTGTALITLTKGKTVIIVATRAGKQKEYPVIPQKGAKVGAKPVNIRVEMKSGKLYTLEGVNGELKLTNHAPSGLNTVATGGSIKAA